MVSSLAYNPIGTTNMAGSFRIESVGYIQGEVMDDPAMRYQLAGGILGTTETLPMWGGVAIAEAVPGGSTTLPNTTLGTIVTRALSLTSGTLGQMTGFSVYNQAHAMINSPTSEAPVALAGMSVHFFRFGSLARVPVQIPASWSSYYGSNILTQFSWDFINQQLTTPQASYANNVVTAATWANTAGGQAAYTTTSAHGVGVGQYVTFSGFTPAGYNGTYLTLAGTAGSTIVVANATNPGTATVQGTLVAGGGILPVKLLDMNFGNSMTPVYNTTTGNCTWNRSGNCALIAI